MHQQRGVGGSMDPDLRAILAALFPDGEPRLGVEGTSSAERYVALPNADRPRFLVPDAKGGAMAATVSSYNRLRPMRVRLLRTGVAAACRLRLVGRHLGETLTVDATRDGGSGSVAPDFLRLLEQRLRRGPLLAAIGLGNVNEHYKPTMQLFEARDGSPVAFAKLGWSSATAPMVERERVVLDGFDGRSTASVRIPRLLDHGTWREWPYLVTEPMPASVRRVPDRDPLRQQTLAIAGRPVSCVLAASPFWKQTKHRASKLTARSAGPRSAFLETVHIAIARLEEASRGRTWLFGRWHGDWTSWNVARIHRSVYAWDWEHSASSAPLGFDTLHWLVSVPMHRHAADLGDSLDAALRSEALGRGQLPRLHLGLAYLIEMALRTLELTAHAPTGTERYAEHQGRLQQVTAQVSRGP